MSFEFLVAYRTSVEGDVRQVLRQLLAKVLEDNLNEFEEHVVATMFQFRYERPGDERVDESGGMTRHMLLSFALELPDEIESAQTVIEEFAAALPDTPPIFHALKFSDPLLQAELAERASEIFALEMKLRHVLSFIYLHAYQAGDPFNILKDESVQPMAKDRLTPEQMRAAAENQLFHLTFSQYISLNKRPDIKLSALLEILHATKDFDGFRAEIVRTPVQQEDDAGLLAGLRERLNAIEHMRNCVAHNRRPAKSVTEHYLNARPLLEKLLDDHMTRWQTLM